jgi:diadenosine tetraphosphate (Ap4A) HIT family hydrolase
VSDAQVDLTAAAAVRPPVPAELLEDPWFPFTGDVRVKALLEPVVPEPPRRDLAGDCKECARSDDLFVWTNAHWRLKAYRPTELLGLVLLETRDHYDSFADIPDAMLAELGPVTARIERAILGLGGIARVQVLRYGDGGEHFHLWFMPRPLGALQLRGSMLPVWMDVLPKLPEARAGEALDRIAAALSAADD